MYDNRRGNEKRLQMNYFFSISKLILETRQYFGISQNGIKDKQISTEGVYICNAKVNHALRMMDICG